MEGLNIALALVNQAINYDKAENWKQAIDHYATAVSHLQQFGQRIYLNIVVEL